MAQCQEMGWHGYRRRYGCSSIEDIVAISQEVYRLIDIAHQAAEEVVTVSNPAALK